MELTTKHYVSLFCAIDNTSTIKGGILDYL